MFTKSKYTLYFYIFLSFIVCLLLIQTQFYLSISYKEALNLYENNSILSLITKTSIYLFGQSDLALRLPFISMYILSVLLMYKITENYFKYESDRFISICIFMLLPGVLSASLLVNTAIICTFLTLLYIYYYKKYNKHLYYLFPFILFVDNSFAIFFLALFFFSFKTKDRKLLYISSIFFILSLYIYGVSTDGKPKGFLIDTFGIYAAILSPVLFLYFIYSLYRVILKKDMDLSWYIASTALVISVLASFRQKIYIEDFAPYVVVVIPAIIKLFLHSYRVRLKEFRKVYSFIAISTILLLLINVLFTFVNKPIYLLLSKPERHFVYQYHFIKEISQELKKHGIYGAICDDKNLAIRLKFYDILELDDCFLSTKEFYNYDEKISIDYYGIELFSVYIKKLI
ncbi:glycosyltransferase family 39 protein [Arcobacter lanthieri]|uniref:glycosyltransferase family 39 protein n=1 Tax=Aliarcobacter lanthieri TaxID=1355374 RepID=UPI001924DE5A|nr:glycosyltransferase family 39 protein [Aliarcobacter lanthieri]MBL3519709.1 glycosyltransferase family 39 protein [Aliarcobacter lanthieri]